MDLQVLVREALLAKGCPDELTHSFDAHSTIQLEFNDTTPVLISKVDDQIILWSQLCEHNPYTLSQRAGQIIELLLEPSAFSATNYLYLCEDDRSTVLRCLIKEDVLNTNDFGDAMEDFYTRLKQYLQVIR
ncbi:hypothetical protein [Pantoea sp. SORGH_AS_0659]|uniref:InvB/SpaK family type III secretion system chaperone n=1 Tax=Pantoea sp. SORGH_AS_0659 TaxID=3062597 RepID=UPI0028646AB8|nr:hypothetical protein [Pantoea sp. SORGH_AS_0659]MDR6352519.1 hypothetical protein [Pantoea sp. SORGH_AS_0659]